MFTIAGTEKIKIMHRRVFYSLALLTLLSTTFLSQPSFAHTALVSSTPIAGSVLEDFPKEIVLDFNEPLLALGGERTNFFELLSPSGERVEIGEMVVEQSRVSSTVPTVPDTGGIYEISYRVVSSDGHVIKGSIDFEFEPNPSITTKTEPEAPTATKSATKVPDQVLIGLILLASSVALIIYAKAGRNNPA
jgi:methionine-rich copper-binding protein CopC